MPKVSLIIPTYHSARYLEPLVHSLAGQTFQDYEAIIIDDCSTDDTPRIIQAYAPKLPRVTILRNTSRLGIAASCNRAQQHAHGEYLIRHDADDLSMPTRFARQVEMLDAHPELVASTSFYDCIDEEDQLLYQQRHPSDRWILLWSCLFSNPLGAQSQVMMRRSALPIPLYDPSVPFAEDYLLWWHLLQRGPIGVIPESLFRYRLHPGSASSCFSDEQDNSIIRIATMAMQLLQPCISNQEVLELRNLWLNGTSVGGKHRHMIMMLERGLEERFGLDAIAKRRLRRHCASVLLRTQYKGTGLLGFIRATATRLWTAARMAGWVLLPEHGNNPRL